MTINAINATITSFRCTSSTTNVHQKVPCKWKFVSQFFFILVIIIVIIIIIIIIIITVLCFFLFFFFFFTAAAVATDLLLT